MILKKLQNLIKRAIQTLTPDDSGNRQTVQVQYLGQTKEVKAVSPYGFFGAPPLNSDWIVLSARGNSDDLYGIGNDYKNRMKNLNEGEVLIMNTVSGDYMLLDSNNTLNVVTALAVNVTSPSVNVDSANATFSGNVTIDGILTVAGVNVNTHTHGGVQSGSSNTDPMI